LKRRFRRRRPPIGHSQPSQCPNGSEELANSGNTEGSRDERKPACLQELSGRSMILKLRLKIVVSPVRVRVSPLENPDAVGVFCFSERDPGCGRLGHGSGHVARWVPRTESGRRDGV
jgi:hypothetical protein